MIIFEPSLLFSSDVPHAEPDTVGTLKRNELGPFGVRTVRDLDDAFACLLFTVDPRNLILLQVDVGSGTIGCQMGVVDGRDCEALAKIL